MPSHIFLRLGLWDEARASSTAAWNASEDAVRSAGQPQSAREFHNLYFGQYAAIQLGRYAEAKRQAEIALDQYDENLRTLARGGVAADAVYDLRHLDRTAVGMAGAYMLSSGDYSLVQRLPVSASNPGVNVLVQQLRAMAAVARNDVAAFGAAETEAQSVLADPATRDAPISRVAANETLATIAHARHDDAAAFRAMEAAVAEEDARPSHPQPTVPVIPAHEAYGRLLLDTGRYEAAAAQFRTALKLFPNRALAMLGAARASRGAGDRAAAARYASAFTAMWSNADPGRPELAEAIATR
jgi:tetratricopeptide (TPR) repeat protein